MFKPTVITSEGVNGIRSLGLGGLSLALGCGGVSMAATCGGGATASRCGGVSMAATCGGGATASHWRLAAVVAGRSRASARMTIGFRTL